MCRVCEGTRSRQPANPNPQLLQPPSRNAHAPVERGRRPRQALTRDDKGDGLLVFVENILIIGQAARYRGVAHLVDDHGEWVCPDVVAQAGVPHLILGFRPLGRVSAVGRAERDHHYYEQVVGCVEPRRGEVGAIRVGEGAALPALADVAARPIGYGDVGEALFDAGGAAGKLGGGFRGDEVVEEG
jgi:hypothetical protein